MQRPAAPAALLGDLGRGGLHARPFQRRRCWSPALREHLNKTGSCCHCQRSVSLCAGRPGGGAGEQRAPGLTVPALTVPALPLTFSPEVWAARILHNTGGRPRMDRWPRWWPAIAPSLPQGEAVTGHGKRLDVSVRRTQATRGLLVSRHWAWGKRLTWSPHSVIGKVGRGAPTPAGSNVPGLGQDTPTAGAATAASNSFLFRSRCF